MKMIKPSPLGAGFLIAFAVLPVLAAGDATKGEKIFTAKCQTCHSLKPGDHKMGPSLAGVFGKKAGSTSFKRYRGLKGANFIWNVKNIDAYLIDPGRFTGKKPRMRSRLKGVQNRADVIEYLKSPK